MSRVRKGMLVLSILLAVAGASALSFTHSMAWGLTAVLWLALLFPVLGGLLVSLAAPRLSLRPASWLAYTTGTGLAVVMGLGLALNTLGLLFHFRAISPAVIIPVFSTLIVLLAAAWYAKYRTRHEVNLFPRTPSYRHKLKLVALLLMPVLAAAGAFRLNNGSGSGLATVALGMVCAYALVSAFMAKHRHPWWYVASLASIALSLGLSVSLRSNHLLGFDINQEYQVFHAVMQQGIWQPHFLDSAYNACLSITIVPAVLNTVIPVSNEYLFKVVMQLLLGIIPLISFVIAARRFNGNKQFAYITGLLFIAQAQFIFQFPGLIRQQVALLFFGLMFMVLSAPEYSRRLKSTLTLVFGLAMVLSHYSTAYICIAVLIIIWGARPILRKMQALAAGWRSRRTAVAVAQPTEHMVVSPILISVLLLFTFLWYGQLLQASGGIVQKITASVTNLNESFKEESRSDFLAGAFGYASPGQDPQNLQAVYDAQSKSYTYQPTEEEYQQVVQSSQGPDIGGTAAAGIYLFGHKVMPLLVSGLLAVGVVTTVVVYLYKGSRPDEAYFGVACGLVFALIVTLPGLSQYYNIDRLYQQILLLIGPAIVYSVTLIGRRLSYRVLSYGMGVLLFLFMTTSTGFVDQLAFRFSTINLTNDGGVYDHSYVRDSEVASLQWAGNTVGAGTLRVDRYSILPATAFTTIPSQQLRPGLLPTEIGRSDYVYASNSNINKGLAFGYYQNHVFTFNFPDSYLGNHKNIIYANEQSRVYR